MIQDAFSIIIPYYEDQTHCEALLQELLRQKKQFPQTEIIIVDDGSKTRNWLDEYRKQAVIIHQRNMGCPMARNKGLDLAQGEYIAFCDCDDMVVPDYLEILYGCMREGYDWVSYDWRFNNGKRSEQYTPGYRNNAVWAYTYRRELIGNNRFNPAIKDGSDDIDFVKRVIDYKKKYFVDSRVIYIYNWFGNENSLQHRICRGEIE